MKKIINHLFRGFHKINGWYFITLLLVFVLGWQLGYRDFKLKWQNYQPKFSVTNNVASEKVDVDFKLFWETWDLVSEKYIDKKALDHQKLYYGAIQGMVAAIGDPYTVFLPPEAQKSTKEQLSGAFEGVGIQLGYNKDKRLVVVAPLKDTPAEKMGVQAGDLILKIDDKDTAMISLPEAVALIRGPKGTSVNLALLQETDIKPRDVEIVRDTIIVRTVDFLLKSTVSGKKIGYLKVSGFGEKTKLEWDESVSDLLAKGVQGVIVDVRNNPGGFLEGSVYLASEFLEKGMVVQQEDAQGIKYPQLVNKKGKLLKLPVVVIINKGSASASEILAGAIQDHKRGILIGESSFGKGTIQSAEDLSLNTGIHITTAKWLTPLGFWVHNQGLTPDIKVEEGSGESDSDLQLEKALELLDN